MKKLLAPVTFGILLLSCSAPKENEHAADSAVADTTKKDTLPINNNQSAFVYGIDISSYQGDEIDFLNKKQDTLTFVICRATLGITFTDSDFKNNWSLIPQNGFIRGAYHFYECDDDPTKQAQHYLAVVGTLAPGDLPPILDFEQAGLAGATDKQKIQSDLLTFLSTVETATGRTPLIYVSPDFANAYLTDPAFAKYPLYAADYNGENQPAIPTVWKSEQWTLWQKTDSVEVNGNQNDFDMFNGNEEALQSFIQGSSK